MLGMIWAQARGGAIGRAGTLPWRLPEDLLHFQLTTSGAAVIMGRHTWESLPERSRPLPNRRNIVVSGRARAGELDGAEVARTLHQALGMVAGGDSWIVGGGQLYEAALPHAGRLVVTEVDLAVDDADTYAPAVDPDRWVLEEPASHGWLRSRTGLRYAISRYRPRP